MLKKGATKKVFSKVIPTTLKWKLQVIPIFWFLVHLNMGLDFEKVTPILWNSELEWNMHFQSLIPISQRRPNIRNPYSSTTDPCVMPACQIQQHNF